MARQPRFEPHAPMDLGDMRSLGVRGLKITCLECHHETRLDVDRWPDHSGPGPEVAGRMNAEDVACAARQRRKQREHLGGPKPPLRISACIFAITRQSTCSATLSACPDPRSRAICCMHSVPKRSTRDTLFDASSVKRISRWYRGIGAVVTAAAIEAQDRSPRG
jgi:hypothetical protein